MATGSESPADSTPDDILEQLLSGGEVHSDLGDLAALLPAVELYLRGKNSIGGIDGCVPDDRLVRLFAQRHIDPPFRFVSQREPASTAEQPAIRSVEEEISARPASQPRERASRSVGRRPWYTLYGLPSRMRVHELLVSVRRSGFAAGTFGLAALLAAAFVALPWTRPYEIFPADEMIATKPGLDDAASYSSPQADEPSRHRSFASGQRAPDVSSADSTTVEAMESPPATDPSRSGAEEGPRATPSSATGDTVDDTTESIGQPGEPPDREVPEPTPATTATPTTTSTPVTELTSTSVATSSTTTTAPATTLPAATTTTPVPDSIAASVYIAANVIYEVPVDLPAGAYWAVATAPCTTAVVYPGGQLLRDHAAGELVALFLHEGDQVWTDHNCPRWYEYSD